MSRSLWVSVRTLFQVSMLSTARSSVSSSQRTCGTWTNEPPRRQRSVASSSSSLSDERSPFTCDQRGLASLVIPRNLRRARVPGTARAQLSDRRRIPPTLSSKDSLTSEFAADHFDHCRQHSPISRR
uniref:Putative secreted protein n=1 Tax=Ixodes ricinus TaxID=34613 RepID=A0A6B0UR63_IXORI